MDKIYYLTYDLPIPYRNIKIYPVLVKDYLHFGFYSQCLTINKNVIPNPEIISMTDLEYIYYSTLEKPEETPNLLFLDRVLSICLKDEKSFEEEKDSMSRYKYDANGKPFFIIGEDKYTSEDFDEIKKIICEQNLIEIPDENISEEVRKSLEEAMKYRNKISGNKSASFEDTILSFATATGWTIEYIFNMTARKFINGVRRFDNYIHYKIFLQASMSGMVEFKDKSAIKHWLTDITEDKYKDASTDYDAIQSEVSGKNAEQREAKKYDKG